MTSEGYVKYTAEHKAGPAIEAPQRAELDDARTRLHLLGLIGANSEGIGFGNLSVRLHDDEFLISGTATGLPPVLGPGGYCLVSSFDIEKNHVVTRGPVQASSESMTHGAVYRSCPGANCVIHIHSRAIFDGMLRDGQPATPENAAYGTPEIAAAIGERIHESGGSEGRIVMAGHDEGVISYGPTVEKAFALIQELYDMYAAGMEAKTEGRAVIFDMDGVLTDSEWFIAEAACLMFKETHGATVSHEDFLPFVGLGENRYLGGVAEKHGIADFEIERDKARTYAIYTEIVKGKLKPMPGAVEFVRRCREMGFKTALATSTDYIKMMANLKEIGLVPEDDSAGGECFFDAMVNGLDVERKKPFPDIFLEAARRIGVAPGNCWVVEDAVGGVQAAKAAGMRCLALLTTYSETEIKNAGPDLIAQDLSTGPLHLL